MAFLVAHHLCVDIVSWHIILQDLQEVLESGSLAGDKPLSFQTWCALQAEQSQQQNHNELLPFTVGSSNLAYWGMEGRSNAYREVEHETFLLSEETTAMALGDCHKVLRTEPVDLFLSSIAHSFCRVFRDREMPILYNEGHGRESWDSTVEPSRTVGWFTTICPLRLRLGSGEYSGSMSP